MTRKKGQKKCQLLYHRLSLIKMINYNGDNSKKGNFSKFNLKLFKLNNGTILK